jgi:glutathione synthase/RimK-type ligase-like ATP-grasp enzyme
VGLATAADVWRDDTDAAPTAAALERAGVRTEPLVWDDPSVDWAAWDLVVVRSTWDYVPRRDEFLAWAERVQAATDLANPASVLRWNTDKHYLRDLAATGVPVVPTTFLDAGVATPHDVDDAVASRGEVVVKPAVSAGSKDTVRHAAGDREAAAAHARALLDAGRDVMVQPYLAAVDDVGETGLVHFDGVLSHAFRKGPLLAVGGGPVTGLYAEESISPRTASAAERAVAGAVLAAASRLLGVDLLYARVDLLDGPDGSPVLLELELCEPSFFLATDPAAADRFAAAAARRASARRRP